MSSHPYNTTALERDIALTLGIPMYGADPRFADLEQDRCRLFAECDVVHRSAPRICTVWKR